MPSAPDSCNKVQGARPDVNGLPLDAFEIPSIQNWMLLSVGILVTDYMTQRWLVPRNQSASRTITPCALRLFN